MKNAIMKKYKGSPKDQWVDFKYWLKTWSASMALTQKQPLKMTKAMFDYPWMFDLSKTVHMVKMYNEGRTGVALKMSWVSFNLYVQNVVRMIQDVILDPDNTVMAQIMVPSQLYQAMDLKWYVVEVPANCMTMVDQHAAYKYFDFVQNCGLPDDTCSYASQTPGIVLAGDSPVSNTCLVCSNLPCEGGAASYGVVEQEFDIPTYRLDSPYNFKEEEGIQTYVRDLKSLIAFLEEHTGHKMDWDKMKVICEIQNQLTDIELERWEMNRTDFVPIPADIIWLSHTQWYALEAGTDYSLELYKKLQKLGRKAYFLKEPAVKNMKYKIIMWSPPTFGYAYFWNWLERCWGIAVMNDMETFSNLTYIDTSSNDSMLEGLAIQWCNSAMSRHNRGPAENWFRDLNKMTEMYKPDFVLNFNHMGCRSSAALTGAMKEWARKRDLPVCFVDYNMYDNRVVSRQGQRDQINSFMLNVMKATPLDDSLLVIDDDDEW